MKRFVLLVCSNYFSINLLLQAKSKETFQDIERRFALEHKTKTRRNRTRRVKKGYETLAFGGIGAAVRLLFSEDPKPEDLGRARPLQCGESRRPRGGGMEIKFSTVSKLFECLERLEAETGQPSLFEALEAGARALKKEESMKLGHFRQNSCMQCAGGTLEARMRDGMPSFAMEQCGGRPSVLGIGFAGLGEPVFFMDRPLPFAAEPSALSRGICLLHYCPLYNRPVFGCSVCRSENWTELSYAGHKNRFYFFWWKG